MSWKLGASSPSSTLGYQSLFVMIWSRVWKAFHPKHVLLNSCRVTGDLSQPVSTYFLFTNLWKRSWSNLQRWPYKCMKINCIKLTMAWMTLHQKGTMMMLLMLIPEIQITLIEFVVKLYVFLRPCHQYFASNAPHEMRSQLTKTNLFIFLAWIYIYPTWKE